MGDYDDVDDRTSGMKAVFVGLFIIAIGFGALYGLNRFESSNVETIVVPWYVAFAYEIGGKWVVAWLFWGVGALWMILGFFTSKLAFVFLVILLAGGGAYFYLSSDEDSSSPGTSESAGDYQSFTAADGRQMEARILEVYPEAGRVKLERRDGKVFQARLDLFSEQDQRLILQSGR